MITSDICNTCICLPACICKRGKELILDCSIIEDDIRSTANSINLNKMIPILFHGLNRKIFIEINNNHVFVLKGYKRLAWACIDRAGGATTY